MKVIARCLKTVFLIKVSLNLHGNLMKRIGYFRVHFSLYFEARLRPPSLLWISFFIHIEIGTNNHNKNFSLLTERLRGTRKWPITIFSTCDLRRRVVLSMVMRESSERSECFLKPRFEHTSSYWFTLPLSFRNKVQLILLCLFYLTLFVYVPFTDW